MKAVRDIEVYTVQYEEFDNEVMLFGKINHEEQSVRILVKQKELNRMLCRDQDLFSNWNDDIIESHDIGGTRIVEMNINRRLGRPLRLENYEFMDEYKLIRA